MNLPLTFIAAAMQPHEIVILSVLAVILLIIIFTNIVVVPQATQYVIERFGKYDNITFVVCDTYDELMKDSDLVISSVTYAESDFCDPSVYKPGCTILPVHMRGFMECDLQFDHMIVSDMVRAKGFKYFDSYKKVTLTDDILEGKVKVRENPEDRVLIYNLGLAITDLYFASKIYELISKEDSEDLRPKQSFYM